MKGVTRLRNQVASLALKRMAVPQNTRMFASQMAGPTPGELGRLPARPLDPIQNADGSFKEIPGYDWLVTDAE